MNVLQRLDLAGFRNYASPYTLSTPAPWTAIVGINGSGKTNLLEALFFACRLRGFRHDAWTKLKTWHTDRGFVRARFHDADREIVWQGANVQFLADGDKVGSRRRWASQLPIFGYRPDDDLFFHDEPKLRRSYLDWLCSYLDMQYMDFAANYERTLKQRNAALRATPQREIEYDVWEKELAVTGAALHLRRQHAVERLAPVYKQLWQRLDREPAQLAYIPGGSADVAANAQKLKTERAADLGRGWTAYGPQRDDFLVSRFDRPIRDSGSQGYRKLAVILLSLACAMVLPQTEHRSLFYLDDIEGELDDDNERRLFTLLAELPLQVLLTAARRPAVLENSVDAAMLNWVPLQS